jgi:hypothetical protein
MRIIYQINDLNHGGKLLHEPKAWAIMATLLISCKVASISLKFDDNNLGFIIASTLPSLI